MSEEETFCPCAICMALTPTRVAPAHFRLDFPLVTGTLRLHLCGEHNTYAQKVVPYLYAVAPEPEEEEKGEEDDESDRDTLREGADEVGGMPRVQDRPTAPLPLHPRHSHDDRA